MQAAALDKPHSRYGRTHRRRQFIGADGHVGRHPRQQISRQRNQPASARNGVHKKTQKHQRTNHQQHFQQRHDFLFFPSKYGIYYIQRLLGMSIQKQWPYPILEFFRIGVGHLPTPFCWLYRFYLLPFARSSVPD